MATKTKIKSVPKIAVEPYTFPFTMGADPEFTVIAGGRPMNAREIFHTFFADLPEGDAGYELPGGNIGWDGHAQIGELRPLPGAPEDVVANLKSMFTEAQKRMPFAELSPLTIAHPTGGHIHLAVPAELNPMVLNGDKKLAAVHRALAAFSLLPMLGENVLSRETRKRTSHNYGGIMDFRQGEQFKHADGKPGYTIEVRSLTAEWIANEQVALGVLAYFAICWDNILKNNLESVADILFTSKKQADQMVEVVLSNFGGVNQLYLNKIRPWVRAHPSYPQYKDALELVLNPEKGRALKKTTHFSVSEGWGLGVSSRQIKSSEFMKEDEIETKTSKLPEAIIRNLSQFAWNQDVNVQAFATALGKRCIALGWKPSNEYFLFGMKQGEDAIVMRDEGGNLIVGEEIIKTKADYDLIARKFERLAPKAEPGFARFLNPRTGEMADGKLKRVMIGIPYQVRQKMDMRPIIKLVLKYEKNPKSLTVIAREALPDGPSKIQAAIEEQDRAEKGIENAFATADKPRIVPPEVIAAENESKMALAGVDINASSRQELFPWMMLDNLRNWHGLHGSYTVFRGRDIPRIRGWERIVETLGSSVESDDYLVWYDGQPETAINLADNEANAVGILSRLFGSDPFEIQRFIRQDFKSVIGGYMRFTGVPGDSFSYDTELLDRNAEGVISEWNNSN